MPNATRVLAINGSYRDGGITDQAIALAARALGESGAEVESVALRDYPIEFCLNCRACCQTPGNAPGQCVHNDGMQELVEKIEQADAYILAAPTNFGSVTAIFASWSGLRSMVIGHGAHQGPRIAKRNCRRKRRC